MTARTSCPTALLAALISTSMLIGCGGGTSEANHYTASAEASCRTGELFKPSPECLREREAQCKYAPPPFPDAAALHCAEVGVAREELTPDEAIQKLTKLNLASVLTPAGGRALNLYFADTKELIGG